MPNEPIKQSSIDNIMSDVNAYVNRMNELNQIITSAKTNVKKRYYMKKFNSVKSKCDKLVKTLDRLLKH
jgi:hypothetical protein